MKFAYLFYNKNYQVLWIRSQTIWALMLYRQTNSKTSFVKQL